MTVEPGLYEIGPHRIRKLHRKCNRPRLAPSLEQQSHRLRRHPVRQATLIVPRT